MDNELDEWNKFIMYTTGDGQIDIEVRVEEENVWLTQNSMAELFNTTRNNITMHIKNIFQEGELQENSVSKESLLAAKDGKNYKTKFYNLDLIISVGYRVKSVRGTQFRIWANQIVKDFTIKGCVMDDERLKNDVSILTKKYFEGQLERRVSAYLDLAEMQAMRHIPMTMEDWEERLNEFLTLWDHDILKDKGKISAEMAKMHAETEFEKYRIVQDKIYIFDFDELLLKSKNIKD